MGWSNAGGWGGGQGWQRAAAAAGFQGLGDVLSGALFYWGLRAYSAAKATAGADCIDIIETNQTFTSTLGVQADGNLNTTTIKAGHMAGSTLAAWIVARGTPFIHKIYDQTGNGFDATSTNGTGPTLNVGGAKPLCQMPGGGVILASSATLTRAQPYSVSTVSRRTSAGSGSIFGSSGNSAILVYDSANNLGFNLGVAQPTIAATDNILHAVQWICQGATSICNVDGSNNTPASNPGTNTISAETIKIGGNNGSAVCDTVEVAGWAGATSGANYGAIQVNQKAWWGTP